MSVHAYQFTPVGVCSRKIIFTLDDNDTILDLRVVGGCPGNSLGISALVKGQKREEVIKKLENIKCCNKPTSCPDQISKALKQYNKKTEEV